MFGRATITLGIGPHSSFINIYNDFEGLACCYFMDTYVIGQAIYIFMLWFLLLLFSSPNVSGRRLIVYNTSTHGVVSVSI